MFSCASVAPSFLRSARRQTVRPHSRQDPHDHHAGRVDGFPCPLGHAPLDGVSTEQLSTCNEAQLSPGRCRGRHRGGQPAGNMPAWATPWPQDASGCVELCMSMFRVVHVGRKSARKGSDAGSLKVAEVIDTLTLVMSLITQFNHSSLMRHDTRGRERQTQSRCELMCVSVRPRFDSGIRVTRARAERRKEGAQHITT